MRASGSIQARTRFIWPTLIAGGLAAFSGCQSDENPGGGGGSPSQGGSHTGGSAQGGTASGGVANTGGSSTGGSNTGGNATGGSNTGGNATGGSTTGGSNIGGNATGGSNIGGNANSGNGGLSGGPATGGTAGAGATSGGGSAKGGASSTGGIAGGGGASGSAGRGGASGGSAGSAGASGGTGGGATGTCPSTATAKAGETTKTVMVGGTSRTYILHVPPGYDGKKTLPLVIDFHPLGGSGSGQKGLSGFAAVADSKGFMVAWPNGLGNSWNVGRCCPSAKDQGVDDVGFTRAIIDQVKTEACLDTKRVYATGCSNGGGMAYMAACKAGDVIAAVAPVDFDCVVGPNNVPSCGGCNPGRPISEIQFRATSDSAVAYNGGPAPIPQGMDFPGAKQNFTDWGTINMCTGTPQTVAGHTACQTYPMCAGGVETTLCTQQGGSHCGNYKSLDIANVAWEAFSKQALP